MPKPNLSPPNDVLENHIIETLIAGLHQWRPDLSYPESYSDMQACVRAVLVMYDVKRRPLPEPLASPCPGCEGLGYIIIKVEPGFSEQKTCPLKCKHGKVYY